VKYWLSAHNGVVGGEGSNPVVPTHSLIVKPKLLEGKPVVQIVIERIYTFVDTFINGLAG
tara:strand:- start:196 stop:375 length:180 start_codon:yes stop_codon:yes gene_type:complete